MSRGQGRGDSLSSYRAKRDFSVTPEPRGSAPRSEPRQRFVVQRHRARRLHYDFRLEVGGALVSWAVPKGPTLDPAARRAAFHVEDHPLEYLDFEGVIPKGEYGGGDVIVWDRGTWKPSGTDDPAAAVAAGEIHFDLDGHKLGGRFVLVRTGQDRGGQERWLMLHKHDDAAVSGWDAENRPESVKSGRTNDEIAKDPEFIWRSDLPADQAEVAVAGNERKEDDGSRRRPDAGKGSATRKTARRKSPERRTSGKAGRRSTTGRQRARWSGPSSEELETLDVLGAKGRWPLQGRELTLSNLDKELFPSRGHEGPVTKRELIRYYTSVAPTILPYLAERPVNMHRYPNGAGGNGFWHKHVPSYAPEWLTRWHDPGAGAGKSETYAVVDSAPALAWMANYAAVELHPWTGRLPDIDRPTWAYIDIDPGTSTTFEEVLVLARLFRTGLDHLGLTALPKLTGSRGIHIWIPIEPRYTFHETSAWVERLSRAVGGTVPELISWTWHKQERQGLARLDYTQNASNKTLVAPYSVRPSPGAPVSAPIEWEELDDPALRSDRFTVRTMRERLDAKGDEFAGLLGVEQSLPEL